MSKIVSKTLSHAMGMHERRLAVTANNLANANTAGYKAVQVSFEAEEPATAGSQSITPVLSSMASYVNLSDAGLVETRDPLDMAIEGNGFFVVDAPEGTLYTRDGRFALDAEKSLVAPSGHRVMGDAGKIILDGQEVAIEPDGSIYVDGRPLGRLKVVRFDDERFLQPVGAALFAYTGEANRTAPAERYSIRQGFRETSNVNVIGEMASLIDTQRSFEAYDKAKKMAGQTTKQLIDLMAE